MYAQIINHLREQEAIVNHNHRMLTLFDPRQYPQLADEQERRRIAAEIKLHKGLAQVAWNAQNAADQCRCGSRHCLACGMTKFITKVNRISEKVHHCKAIT